MAVLRWLLRLPVATAAGCALSLVSALVYLILLPACREPDAFSVLHPLIPFAVCTLPAIGGLWVDWARLYRPSGATRFWSGLGVLAALGLAFEGGWLASGAESPAALVLGPMTLGLAAVAALAAGRILWWAATRGPGRWRVVAGEVSRDEKDRLVIRIPDAEVVELPRDAADLGEHRTLDIALGQRLAILGRFEPVIAGDPFRSEPRLLATRVAVAAPSVVALHSALARRARGWALFLALLALGSLGLGAAIAYGPDPEPDCAAMARSA